MRTIPSWISGKPVQGLGDWHPVLNPATGETFAEFNAVGPAELDDAVEAALECMNEPAFQDRANRAKVLKRAAEIIRERTTELAAREVEDTGKPIYEAESYDIPSAAEVIEFFSTLASMDLEEKEALEGDYSGHELRVAREPVGVCGCIGAWNYPFQIAAWKIAPAIAAGCGVVFKPAELTPSNAPILAEILEEAGLPSGAVNVVQGGPEVGEAICRHPKIAKISLTGEVTTGKKVMAAASEGLKRVTLELGGKSPLVVLPDADMEQAASLTVSANFLSQGEVCSNGTRVFVPRDRFPEFREALLAAMDRVKIGDPNSKATNVGALISAEHKEKVDAFVEQARRDDVPILEFGELPTDAPFSNGFFTRPAVLLDPDDDRPYARQEIFGPVACVLGYDSVEEAVKRANDTEFGLAAGVLGNDVEQAQRVAAQLKAGVVWVNTFNITPACMPYGGVKLSGLGRENGREALLAHLETKSILTSKNPMEHPWT